MDPQMLRELVTSQLGREPTEEEFAKISQAMGAVQTGQVQLSPEQQSQAMQYAQGRMASPSQDPGTVNYFSGPSWSANAPGRSGGGPGDADPYSWDSAGPGDYQTPEANRAKLFAAQDKALPDNVVNNAWQTGMAAQAAQPKAEPPPYNAMKQDIAQKKAFVAGVQAATAGAQPLPTGGAQEMAAANKKAAADVAALEKDAKKLDAPKKGDDIKAAQDKAKKDVAALEEDAKALPAAAPATYQGWNTATPAAKQEAWATASKQAGKSMTGGEFQMQAQKQEAAKPKFDPKSGTFSNVPMGQTAAPKPQVMSGVEAPSKAAVEEQLGMTITPTQYKQWLAKNGF